MMAAPDDVSAHLARRASEIPIGLGGTTRLVCIDGPAGSGKTTLAGKLAALLPAQVIHMDDLYAGWTGLEAGVAKLHEWVLNPLAAGRSGRYQRYDWHLESYAERHLVPAADFLVIEGCGAGAQAVEQYTPLIIWVEAEDDVRLTRGLDRDGQHALRHWLRFMEDERVMFDRDGTRSRADVLIDGFGKLLP